LALDGLMRKKAFTAKKAPGYLYGILLLLPLALYYFSVYLFAENIPLSDDFSSVLGFLGSFLSAESFSEKIKLLFSQLNEHRIVFNRLVSLLVFKVNGCMDFKLLLYAGNLLLLPAIYAVYLSFKKKSEKVKYFLPAIIILTVPQFTGSMFWATSAVQNISCLAFSLLALVLLRKEGLFRELSAFSFAVLAVLASGNGLFVLPAAISCLFIVKRNSSAFWWTAASALLYILYFYGYTVPVHDKLYYAVKPESVLEFFFVFLGSPVVLNVFYMKNLFGSSAETIMRIFCALIGAGVVTYFIFLIKKKYYRLNPAIFTIFILFFLTAFAAAVTRSGIGPMQAFASRYRVIPVFIFALVYISFIELYKENTVNRYYKYLLILAVLFSVFSYIANLPEIKYCRNNLVKGITSWQKDGTGLNILHDDPVYAGKLLKKSVEKGLYLK